MPPKHNDDVARDHCVPADWGRGRESLREAAKKIPTSLNFIFIHLDKCISYSDFWNTHQKPWNYSDESSVQKIVVLLSGKIDQYSILSWRAGLHCENKKTLLPVFRILPDTSPENWEVWLKESLHISPYVETREKPAVTSGAHIEITTQPPGLSSYDPGFLTIHPAGRITEVLDELDACKRRFSRAIPASEVLNLKPLQDAVRRLLEFGSDEDRRSKAPNSLETIDSAVKSAVEKIWSIVDRNALPRILLLGESGVGKTLLARYLAVRTDVANSRPFRRISLPEYLDKEESFEYNVFGYCRGAYTDARKTGNPGVLLSSPGGVVFFDEIGDTSPAIQAKLLAYLDDYCVRPCGWEGEPVFCPTMVVAATNQPIEKWLDRGANVRDDRESYPDRVASHFRRDLFERFTTCIHVPSLNERKEELQYILEAMLLMDAFNPGKQIREIGQSAFDAIHGFDYSHSNFRALETIVREACNRAICSNRDYVVKSDVHNLAKMRCENA